MESTNIGMPRSMPRIMMNYLSVVLACILSTYSRYATNNDELPVSCSSMYLVHVFPDPGKLINAVNGNFLSLNLTSVTEHSLVDVDNSFIL